MIPEPYVSGPAATVVPRGVIRAAGPDSESYLQGQLSQDLAPLAPGESAWSLLLQPQGKVDAWLRVTRIDGETFLLDVDASALDHTLTRLNRFKLRTKCDLVPETWQVLSVRGPGSNTIDVPVDSGAEVVAPSQWPGVEGIDLLGPAPTLDTALVDVAQASAADLETLRILSGVPAMTAELTEDTIPAEAGIVDRSVSFTKGCYTGQELVARIDSRGGNVPKRLRGIVASEPVEVGAAVVIGEDIVGMVTSAAGVVALAYVKRAVESFPVAASVGDTPAEVRVLPLI
jgi:folate-binding protein YgfZ